MRRTILVPLALPVLLALPASASAASSRVGCVAQDAPRVVGKAHPTRCAFVRRGGDPGVSANLTRASGLRWRGWGTSRATSRATNITMGVTTRFRITLSGRHRCGDGRLWYSRLRLSGGFHGSFRLRRCG